MMPQGAEWIAVELERAGYTTIIQAFDFPPGSDFVHEMQVAVRTAARTIAVLSPAYFESAMSEAEWRSVFAGDPTGEFRRLLVPVRVEPFEEPGLLRTRVYIDLVDVNEVTARKRLLDGVASDQLRPTTAVFPGFPSKAPKPPSGVDGISASLEALQADVQSIVQSAATQGWRVKLTDATLRLWTRNGKRLTFSIGAPGESRIHLRAFVKELRANGLRVNRRVRLMPGFGQPSAGK